MAGLFRVARGLLGEVLGNSTTAEQVAAAHGADLTGRVAVVTGANSGVGKETARVLAAHNAHVVLACRSRERGEAALVDVLDSAGPSGSAEVMDLDLASLASVRAFAEAFERRHPGGLHLLVNNAGVMFLPRFSPTEDGVEKTFGVCHLGHFLLTRLLADSLARAAPSRVVNVSSLGHNLVPSQLPEGGRLLLPPQAEGYDGTMAYAWAKLCNVLFSAEAQRRLGARGVAVAAVHPGVIHTNLHQYSLVATLLYSWPVRSTVGRLVFKSVEQGAATSVHAATCPHEEVAANLYFANCAPSASVHPLARDEALAGRLWEVSEELSSSPPPPLNR